MEQEKQELVEQMEQAPEGVEMEEKETGQAPKRKWSRDKKQTAIVVSVCALVSIIAIVVITFLMGVQNTQGKDVYELFEWGTKKETVYKKLDKMDVNYYSYDDESGSGMKIYVSNVQGSEKGADVLMSFGESGVLKSISSYISWEENEADEAVEAYLTMVENLNSKYKVVPSEKDNEMKWESNSWTITLTEPEIAVSKLLAKMMGLRYTGKITSDLRFEKK